MFSNTSSFNYGVDLTFAIILAISVFFLVGITAVMIYFVIRYHHKRNPVASNIKNHVGLEILWTVVPTILVMVMFYFGWAGYNEMRKVPKDAMVVKVTGRMWSWSFEYPNGKTTDTLVVPVNQAVRLELYSPDVVHSLYIPAFRVKEDLVPGDNNYMWFKANEEGSYNIFCAEYCGTRHSNMISKVVVVKQEFYDKWISDTAKVALTGIDGGLALLKANACLSCHTTDGSAMVGPSFKGIMGRKTTVVTDAGEKTITVDDAYIINSMNNPNEQVVKGFNKGLMMEYKEKLSDDEKKMIVEYLKTLK